MHRAGKIAFDFPESPDERCRRRVLKRIGKAKTPTTVGPFVTASNSTVTASFLAARCGACGRCGDMPPVTPQSLLGLPDDGVPPLRLVPRT